MIGRYSGPLVLSALLLSHPATARRTDENAVREAEDGFGKSVGNDAGTNRVEGLHFEKAGQISNVIVRGT